MATIHFAERIIDDPNQPDATIHFADRIIDEPNQPNATPRNLKDVADKPVLVGQIREVFDAQRQVEVVIDVELISAEWMFQFSIENEAEGMREKVESTEVGMVVTSGQETSASVSASAGFSGWGFSAEINASTEWKTFSSLETANVRTVTDRYECPGRSSIFVYKRKYKFRCRTWIYDARHDKYWMAKNGVFESSFTNEIIANQELISPIALSNHGKITGSPSSGLARPQRDYWIPDRADPSAQEVYWRLAAIYPWVYVLLPW